jgi:putative transposase
MVLERTAGISDQSIYTWRRQDRINRGLEPGLSSSERSEMAAAKRRIADLRPSCAPCAGRWSWSERWYPKRRFQAAAVITAEGIPVKVACRVLDMLTSG